MEHARSGGEDLRAHQRAQAAARFGVSGDFMRVPQLAKALGISQNSIRSQMRKGVFPMPHRRLGDVLVVRLDDYVAWSNSDPTEQSASQRAPASELPVPVDAPAPAAAEAARVVETPKQRADRIKREVLAGMARRGAKR